MTAKREDLSGLKLARSIIEENWPADALLEIVDSCIAEAQSAEPVQGGVTKELAALAWQMAFAEGDAAGDMSFRVAKHVSMLLTQHNRIMAAAKPDAELVELLRQCLEAMRTPYSDTRLMARIDAKLAEANKP
jgi:hypothetical protein